jgi:hypothetical protein
MRQPVVHRLVPTLDDINTELPQSPQLLLPDSINCQKGIHRFADSDLNAQPTVVSQHVVFPNPTLISRHSSSRPFDHMYIDSLAQTAIWTGRVSRPPSECW